jgi:membrane protease YdiL (CAAX protease family)
VESRRIASLPHTAGVILALAAFAVRTTFNAEHLRHLEDPPRLPLYAEAFCFEWLLLAFILWGASRSAVLGPRWESRREILRDIGFAGGFWVISGILLAVLSRLIRSDGSGSDLQFMLPRNLLECVMWVAVSVTAGICEEATFRGYLQAQFAGITGSATAGIVLSAVIFGACHAYQGLRGTILIACYGAMFGLLAHKTRSVRPGMIAHTWQDTVSGLLLSRFR